MSFVINRVGIFRICKEIKNNLLIEPYWYAMERYKIIIIGILVLLFINAKNSKAESNDEVEILWADSFTKAEQTKLTNWLTTTYSACEKVLGKYTFEFNLVVHRRDNSDEPVPWAHTSRLKVQSVHFYVNPDFSLQDFIEDWTAVHEISHLSIPYLGPNQKWFAEGYATYVQNLILLDMGVYDKGRYDRKYKYKLDNARPHFTEDKSFISVVTELGLNYNYPEMYYGGACFFIELDKKFRAKLGNGFLFYIKKYQQCCRKGFSNLDDFISDLDKVTKSKITSKFLSELNENQLIF